MTPNGRPRRRREASSLAPTSLTECARRYHGAALALARTFGLPLTEDFLQAYHAAIAAVYIEAGHAGVRLPPAVHLPPLGVDAPVVTPDGMVAYSEDTSPDSAVATLGDTSAADGVDVTPPTGDAPLPTRIPAEGDWPCAGHEITRLKPAQLHLLLARAGFRAHADTTLMPLLAALQVKRARRMEAGRRPKLVAVEGDGHGP